MRRAHAQSVRITSAALSVEDDRRIRTRRYLISMAIRTVCVVAAFFVPLGWPLGLCLIGAVILPYVAVIAANAVSQRTESPLAEVQHARGLPR